MYIYIVRYQYPIANGYIFCRPYPCLRANKTIAPNRYSAPMFEHKKISHNVGLLSDPDAAFVLLTVVNTGFRANNGRFFDFGNLIKIFFSALPIYPQVFKLANRIDLVTNKFDQPFNHSTKLDL